MKPLVPVIGLFLLSVALLPLSGCSKTEITDSVIDRPENILSFHLQVTGTEATSRALESNNNSLQVAASSIKAIHIPVDAYVGTPGASLAPYFIDSLGYFAFQTPPAWELISGKQRFLPENGMNLYSLFGTELGDLGDLSGISNYTRGDGNRYPSFDFTANTDEYMQVDLIAAKAEGVQSRDVVLRFQHILSQINFGVQGYDNAQITISNIRLNNVRTTGHFDFGSWAWSYPGGIDGLYGTYSYYFPDWQSTRGSNYSTTGGASDSNNTYIFGDGGNFGPDNGGITHWYAQTHNVYKLKEESEPLSNSLMLIPQRITENLSASVTFDYEVRNASGVIAAETGKEILLSQFGVDWEPNYRYVYIFELNTLLNGIGISSRVIKQIHG